MSLEDPFFVVKDEVQKAVQTARSLYQRWCEIQEGKSTVSKEEYDWTSNELRNSLRSIEWDLEDLEETISIVEGNPKKFRIDDVEIADRKSFILRTKEILQEMKARLCSPGFEVNGRKESQGLIIPNGPKSRQDQYQPLKNEIESANEKYIQDTHRQQQLLADSQDDQLDLLGSSVTTLKDMSHHIGNELDEQAVMLDDFAHEMDTTESKLDNVMKKMAKVLHISNDRRQWCAIGILLLIMIIVIILFIVL